MKNGKKNSKLPFVSICTPTFNRRPFIPMMIKCFEHQTYPKDKIEWIIIDDGTDKIEDLVSQIPQVKYFKYDEKITLGKKRNISNEKAKGDIILYMDDDDYYPPERISHAVETLQANPTALCAGSSIMFIYFKHINKLLQFGPYGPNHSTAATFAFKKELLLQTKFDENTCVAEEKKFLKDYTIPFVQLDPRKSILVFSHNHNSYDKKDLLKQMPSPCIHETFLTPFDLVKEKDILQFFMKDIDNLLENYILGKPENKEDVNKQLKEIQEKRDKIIKENEKKQEEYQNNLKKSQQSAQQLNQQMQSKLDEQIFLIQELSIENSELKDKVKYLENKLKQLIHDKIQQKIENKMVESSV
jgi:glycosyltransferase involved in cell wall biosynthesis